MRLPNQKSRYAKLNGRLNKYVLAVQNIYDKLNLEAAKIVDRSGFLPGGVFRFSDFPMTSDAVNKLQSKFVEEMHGLIYRGTSEEWKNSNLVQDLLATKALKSYGATIGGQKTKVYYQTNSDALKAFQNRVDKGMNLSTKLWSQAGNYKQELEYAISSAIEKGTSAVTLSKRLSKYLNDFPSLKSDYKEKFGTAVDCHDCEYRSMRLARSEINMAYRTAEQTRWNQMDFVVGYEIKLSGAHPHDDICDVLAGKYPKDFFWTGWHPNDMCYVIPILKTEEEFWGDSPMSVNQVEDVPQGFKGWVVDNQERLAQAELRGTMPYWAADNREFINRAELLEEREYVMSEEAASFLKTKGFHTLDASLYNSSLMSGFDLEQFDREIEDICDDFMIKITMKSLEIKQSGLCTLTYEGDCNGQFFTFVRNFLQNGKGEKYVEHELMKVPANLQGKGVSKRLMKAMFRQYERCGIKEVKIYANLDVGGYCWGQYGFSVDVLDAYGLARGALARGRITQLQYEEVVKIIDKCDGDWFPMNRLSNLPYGEKMLKGDAWNGMFDLTNAEQMRYFKDYVNW